MRQTLGEVTDVVYAAASGAGMSLGRHTAERIASAVMAAEGNAEAEFRVRRDAPTPARRCRTR